MSHMLIEIISKFVCQTKVIKHLCLSNDGFFLSIHENGGEVSSKPRRPIDSNSFAGERKNSKLCTGGGPDLGR